MNIDHILVSIYQIIAPDSLADNLAEFEVLWEEILSWDSVDTPVVACLGVSRRRAQSTVGCSICWQWSGAG